MDIGLMTDSVAALTTVETLDLAADLGLDTVEFATGNARADPAAAARGGRPRRRRQHGPQPSDADTIRSVEALGDAVYHVKRSGRG